MSTFGRDSDRQAEVKRRYQRQLAEKAICLRDVIRFSIATLRDESIDDRQARQAVLDALSSQTWSYSDFRKTSSLKSTNTKGP